MAAVLLAIVGLAVAPAVTPAAPLIAAFERYVPGNGFDIGLVDATTGAALPVPAGVNTAADEFHPALTPSGQFLGPFLVFSRTTLLVKPNGDVIPPEAREVIMVDRRNGQSSAPFGGTVEKGSGPTIVPTSGHPMLAVGSRIPPAPSQDLRVTKAGTFSSGSGGPDGFRNFVLNQTTFADLGPQAQASNGTFVDIPHAAVAQLTGRRLKATAVVSFVADSGRANSAATTTRLIEDDGTESGKRTLLLSQNRPQHATPRVLDGHLALDITTASGTDIADLQFPSPITTPAVMPAPINTSNQERMPAWSPDGVQLGFIRTKVTQLRTLHIFDSTPGLQTIVNPAIALGAEAPTTQLREFQATWGGLSLALTSAADSVSVGCAGLCIGAFNGSVAGRGVGLQPILGTTPKLPVGIVIARRVGTRRLFGSKIPRIRTVGRVPLGIARSSKPKFRWNGRVNGRRLPPGNYLLTFRTLTGKGRILSTSRSIQFKLTRAGQVTGARALKS